MISRAVWLGLLLSSLFVFSSGYIYSDEMLEIRESELRELERINEEQANRLKELESLLEAQERTLTRQRETIESLQSGTLQLAESSETLSRTIGDLGRSFELYESGRRAERIEAMIQGGLMGWAVLRLVEAGIRSLW